MASSPPLNSGANADDSAGAARQQRKHQRPGTPVLPKTNQLLAHLQAYLNAVALLLNQRPRKTLGFETPAIM
jgi:hypothetical protein